MNSRQKGTSAAPGVHRPGPRKIGRTRRLWIVDIALFVTFLLVMNVPLTGIPVHEWLSIAIGAVMLIHLVQHGDWLTTVTARFRSATSLRNRLNYLMTGLLFLAFVSIILSGLVISETAVPWIGITTSTATFWLWLHLASVDAVLVLTALHVALNWLWIATSFQRFVVKPLRARSARRTPTIVYPTAEEAS